jgi:hypothetical protein
MTVELRNLLSTPEMSRQGARLFELHASSSVARLWREQARHRADVVRNAFGFKDDLKSYAGDWVTRFDQAAW